MPVDPLDVFASLLDYMGDVERTKRATDRANGFLDELEDELTREGRAPRSSSRRQPRRTSSAWETVNMEDYFDAGRGARRERGLFSCTSPYGPVLEFRESANALDNLPDGVSGVVRFEVLW